MSLLTKYAARYASQPSLDAGHSSGSMPWMAGQSRFGAMSPLGGIGGMNPQQQQAPNPAAQIAPPQPGLATPQGIQQLAQKAAGTAHLNAFELLHDVLYGQLKRAETSSTGGNAASSGSSGGGNAGSGAGGGQGFGVHSIGGAPGAGTAGQNAGAQQANAPGAQMAGNNGLGGGQQAGGLLQRPATGAQGGVGAFGIVRPGLPSPGPLGGGNSMGPGPKLAGLYTKYAMGMMTPGPGGLQPQPGLTANQPPPPGPTMPGQVPAGPGQPQPGGGAPMAAGAQPQQGAQPGAPAAQPPMTPPMAEPTPPPLPMNPRPQMPQQPMSPAVMQQTQSLDGLLGAKQEAEMGDGGQQVAPDGGPGDMAVAGMAMGAKMAAQAAWHDAFSTADANRASRMLKLAAPYLKTGLEKGANEDNTAGPTSLSRGWQWRYMQQEAERGQKQWMPRQFTTDATPLAELLASPGKQGLLGAGLGAGLGGLGGVLASDTAAGGLAGAGLGGLLGGVFGYSRQRKRNDRILDDMHHMPPGATVGGLEQLKKSATDPFSAADWDSMREGETGLGRPAQTPKGMGPLTDADRAHLSGGLTAAPPPPPPPKPGLLNRPNWMVNLHGGEAPSTALGRLWAAAKGVGTDLRAGLGGYRGEQEAAERVHSKTLAGNRAERMVERTSFEEPGRKLSLQEIQKERYARMMRQAADPKRTATYTELGADPHPLRARVFGVDAARSSKRLLSNIAASRLRGKNMLLGGGLALASGGAGLGVGEGLKSMLGLGKQSAQADDGKKTPARSATGESTGLSYTNKQDQYAQGSDAWASVSKYFKGGRRMKQPNPFAGIHKGASFTPTISPTILGMLLGGGIGGLHAAIQPKEKRDVVRGIGRGGLIGGAAGLGLSAGAFTGAIGGGVGGLAYDEAHGSPPPPRGEAERILATDAHPGARLGMAGGALLGGVGGGGLGAYLAHKATRGKDEKTAGAPDAFLKLLGGAASRAPAAAPAAAKVLPKVLPKVAPPVGVKPPAMPAAGSPSVPATPYVKPAPAPGSPSVPATPYVKPPAAPAGGSPSVPATPVGKPIPGVTPPNNIASMLDPGTAAAQLGKRMARTAPGAADDAFGGMATAGRPMPGFKPNVAPPVKPPVKPMARDAAGEADDAFGGMATHGRPMPGFVPNVKPPVKSPPMTAGPANEADDVFAGMSTPGPSMPGFKPRGLSPKPPVAAPPTTAPAPSTQMGSFSDAMANPPPIHGVERVKMPPMSAPATGSFSDAMSSFGKGASFGVLKQAGLFSAIKGLFGRGVAKAPAAAAPRISPPALPPPPRPPIQATPTVNLHAEALRDPQLAAQLKQLRGPYYDPSTEILKGGTTLKGSSILNGRRKQASLGAPLPAVPARMPIASQAPMERGSGIGAPPSIPQPPAQHNPLDAGGGPNMGAIKAAGLTPFAEAFFTRCLQTGVDPRRAIEKVGSDYPEAVRSELRDGLTKMAGGWDALASRAGAGAKWLGGKLGMGPKPPAYTPRVGAPGARPQAGLPPQSQATIGNMGNGVQSRGQQAWNAVKPHAISSGGGAIVGATGGEQSPWDTGSTWGNAALGALTFNKGLNRFAARTGGAGAVANVPLRSYQGSMLGGWAGGLLDSAAPYAGLRDTVMPDGSVQKATHFGEMGGSLGAAFGGMSGAGRALSRLPGGMGAFGTKLQHFGEGALSPITRPINAVGKAIGAVKTPASAVRGPATTWGRAAGVGAGGLFGANQVMQGAKQQMAQTGIDTADAYLHERLPQMQQQLGEGFTGMADEWLQQRGLMNEQGQVDLAGPAINRVTGGADGIFRGMGMDPSRLSPLQKMMMLGGAGMAGGGAMAGAPMLAGAGGLAMLGGGAPYFMGGGRQGGQSPGMAQGGGQSQPNGMNARDEWMHQRQYNQRPI